MNQDTRSQLLTQAEAVVRGQGYAGFSYSDLTERVGIRKASIHHHFPLKEDLGVALVEAYTERFTQSLEDITAATPAAFERLRAYGGLYRSGLQAGQGCLCGVLASELNGLPDRIRAGVRRFFDLNADWLERIIADGQSDGSFRSDLSARAQAMAVLASLEGAMLVGRALGSVDAFDAAAAASLKGLQKPRC